MKLEPLRGALAEARPGGRRAAGWTVYASETRRLTLGTQDRETGNAHAPLALIESFTARYRIVWDDGRVSRGMLERRVIETDPVSALAGARAAAYEDPDAIDVAGPDVFSEVPMHDAGAAS